MNKGGFSWKRFIGITRIKQKVSRRIGIPLTRSGRQRKLGAIIMGKGCLVLIGLITTIIILITSAILRVS
jgi:hypothetical protein